MTEKVTIHRIPSPLRAAKLVHHADLINVLREYLTHEQLEQIKAALAHEENCASVQCVKCLETWGEIAERKGGRTIIVVEEGP